MSAPATLTSLTILDDRYPNDIERETLIHYARSMSARKAALLEIQKVDHEIAVYAIDILLKQYPRFSRYHPLSREKGIRDMHLIIGAAGKTMFLNDIEWLNNHMLIWVRTIFRSINMTPKFLLDGFNHMRDGVKRYTSPQTFALMEPVIAHVTAFLSDIPEPAVPEV